MKTKSLALLALLFILLISSAALAANGDADIAFRKEMEREYQDSILGACVLGDALYLYGDSYFYTYHIGDEGIDAVEFTRPVGGEYDMYEFLRLFSDGESLCMLCAVYDESADLYELDRLEILPVEIGAEGVAFGAGMKADADGLDGGGYIAIYGACYMDGYLMLHTEREGLGETVYSLGVDNFGRVWGVLNSGRCVITDLQVII